MMRSMFMSEFSESYHLRTDNQQDVVNLIKETNNKGYVFPAQNGWVTFVVEGSAFDIDESVISQNPGILVHYIFAEDHGWELRVFRKDDLIFEYACGWTDEIQIEKSVFNIDVLTELIMEQGNSAEGIESLFDVGEETFNMEQPPAYTVAEKLGLTYYEWLSADYLGRDDIDEHILVVEYKEKK